MRMLFPIAAGLAVIFTLGTPATAPAQTRQATTKSTRLSQTDQAFIQQAAVGGVAALRTAELAAGRTENVAVRMYAQRMLADNAAANDQLLATSARVHFKPVMGLDARQNTVMQQLSQLKGAQFDALYAYAMLSNTQQSIQIYQAAAASSNPVIRSYARATLPVLQAHLQQAQVLTQEASIRAAFLPSPSACPIFY